MGIYKQNFSVSLSLQKILNNNEIASTSFVKKNINDLIPNKFKVWFYI